MDFNSLIFGFDDLLTQLFDNWYYCVLLMVAYWMFDIGVEAAAKESRDFAIQVHKAHVGAIDAPTYEMLEKRTKHPYRINIASGLAIAAIIGLVYYFSDMADTLLSLLFFGLLHLSYVQMRRDTYRTLLPYAKPATSSEVSPHVWRALAVKNPELARSLDDFLKLEKAE